ncbi:hypothetical protein C8A01DRAFT_17837 [Parachaetomium inaequale]|uniref:Sulfate transporter n=1 Tax=Parachaetomium inaequale TaxID=2588326 RepID=A0AAN6PBU9_9PEZI|nr:hypothetical protein C8A01DRAFT_17837 [Parachaetomium inaequale]
MQRPAFISELARRNRHNVRTLRESPAAEISGALGDLGTLLPLMIALALQGSIDLASTLVFSGLFNIITGAVFGIPLPVQPMKAIAAAALTTRLPQRATTASGALVSLAVLLLSATGALRLLTRHIPAPVVKGIQLGAGLRLVVSGAALILGPLNDHNWNRPPLLLIALAFFILFFTERGALGRRFPYALLLFLVGVWQVNFGLSFDLGFDIWRPAPPTLPDFGVFDAWSTALSQLPLTTLNSVVAVSALAAELMPDLPTPGVNALGWSVAGMNLVGCWFGVMPVCHGAGGLAAQHRFGARSGASIILLGTLKLLLGLLFGNGTRLAHKLAQFPKSVLGVMVIAAGLELAKVGSSLLNTPPVSGTGIGTGSAITTGGGASGGLWQATSVARTGGGRAQIGVREREEKWMVMMVTAAGILAFRNDAVGFCAGLCCHGAYRAADWVERRWDPEEGERRPLLS